MILERVYTGADRRRPGKRADCSARRQREMRIFEQADRVAERIVHSRDLDPSPTSCTGPAMVAPQSANAFTAAPISLTRLYATHPPGPGDPPSGLGSSPS